MLFDAVEVRRGQAEKILMKTMVSVGYNKAQAQAGIWSAFWLEERFSSGLTQLIVYLLMLKQKGTDNFRPRPDDDFGLAGNCPFMLSEVVLDLSDSWVPGGEIAFGAPASPLLMMASIANWASVKKRSVRFRHLNYSCLMSDEGIEIETNDRSMIGWVQLDRREPMMIELTEDRPRPGFRRLTTVKLPKARFRGNEALDLG